MKLLDPLTLKRRRTLSILTGLLLMTSGNGWAQSTYPDKPIKMVVPYAAGGAVDIYARTVQPSLSRELGQAVIIENKPGASGMLGADHVAKASPDGYTLLVGNIANLAINVPLYEKMSYNPVTDFTALRQTVQVNYVLVVTSSLQVGTVEELIAYAKANPGKLSYASSGAGSAQHMAAELFKSRTGIQMVHVPYKGTGAIVSDLIAGHVQVAFADQGSMMPQVKAGKLKALAVGGLQRSPEYPQIPSVSETSGLDEFEAVAWQGMAAPAGLPENIKDRLVDAFNKVQNDPETRAKLLAAGFSPVESNPQHFTHYIQNEIRNWTDVARKAKVALD